MVFKWDDRDAEAVVAAKLLAADAVEAAGSGHPGAPISLAPAAYLLFQRHLRFDPQDPDWIGRDRFLLSAGHASALQYVQNYLSGAGLELDDLKNFRQFGAVTAGHPEYRHAPGVEVTTGPLGSGLAAGVGMAMAARRQHGLFDPETPLGQSPFDHNIYVIAGDGCMQEGITSEASSLAGTQNLGNLIVIYDDNHISIEDDTSIAFTEDVLARYDSYGWHTQRVNWLQEDGSYTEDVEALNNAIEQAKAQTDRPSIIALRTIIGWPTPGKSNTGAIHGAKLGDTALSGLKEALGADPAEHFAIDQELVDYTRKSVHDRTAAEIAQWDHDFAAWGRANRDRVPLFNRLKDGELPEGWEAALPDFSDVDSIATRAASGKVINALAPVMPELWGGSADLAGSNNTLMNDYPSFIPAERSSSMFAGDPYGRNLHFGVREHAMGGIMNGIAADRLTRIYGGTFFVFADYMRGAVRLAALMKLPVIYIWTHDSIGVGEDGPTHQPVEHLAAYRAIPDLAVVRPADASETVEAWKGILRDQTQPSALILTRQNVPNPKRGAGTDLATAEGVTRGAYVIADTPGTPDVILMASGSELQLALAAKERLSDEGVAARVVSVPCMEWFNRQPKEYRDRVLPPDVRARVSVEAGLALPWTPYLGNDGVAVSLETFGAPGPGDVLFKEFGFTTDAVVAAAQETLANTR